MLSRLRQALPLAAGPLVLGAHIGAEALVSGRSLLAVAAEPLHAYLFLFAAVTAPLWLITARQRLLRLAVVLAVASSLGLEGNGLGTLALTVALLIGGTIAWLGGMAIERASAVCTPALIAHVHRMIRCSRVVLRRAATFGPYFAFVPIRGNRPPPQLLQP